MSPFRGGERERAAHQHVLQVDRRLAGPDPGAGEGVHAGGEHVQRSPAATGPPERCKAPAVAAGEAPHRRVALGADRGPLEQVHPGERRLVVERAQVGADAEPQLAAPVLRLAGGRGHPRLEHLGAGAVGGGQARLLGLEQLVERPARDPREAHRVGDGGGLVALLGHRADHRVEQLGALRAALEQGRDVGVARRRGTARSANCTSRGTAR